MDSSHIPSTSPPLATENSLAYPDTGYSCISVANNAPVKKGRKQPERYLFSKEITVHHRKEKAYNGKFIVKSDADLMSSHVAQISEIIYTEAGILPANVKIICK